MSHSNPKVSVIIPVDGTEDYLGKCLDSIINQTIEEIEIIVVNDCSPGNTVQTLEPYFSDARLKYIELDRKLCLGGARNVGIRSSKGKYITFCDSDDWVDLSLYEEMYSALEKSKSEIANCSLYREYPDKREGIYKCYYDRQYIIDSTTAFKVFTFEYNYSINIVGQVTNKMYDSVLVNKNNLYFIENAYYEDLDYNFRALLLSKNITCVPYVKYHHLRRNASIVQSISKRHIRDFFTTFKQIRRFLKEIDCYDEYKLNYYAFSERFYNLIVRQIFQFQTDENTKKKLLRYSFKQLPEIFNINEFIDYTSAEKLRRHIQPYIENTEIK